jgi:hypothetical protein
LTVQERLALVEATGFEPTTFWSLNIAKYITTTLKAFKIKELRIIRE